MNGRTILLLAVLIGSAAAIAFLLFGQGNRVDPTPAQRAIAEDWLLRECTDGDAAWLNDSLRAAGAALESLFITAFETGPDSTLKRRVDTLALRLYGLAVSMVDTNRPATYPAAEYFLADNDSAFVAAHTSAFTFGYRTRALIGLGVIATPVSLAKLDSVVADTTSLFHRDAVEIRTEAADSGFFRIK